MQKGACDFLRRIIGKRVRIPYGPAAVREEPDLERPLRNREGKIRCRNSSQKTCLFVRTYTVTEDGWLRNKPSYGDTGRLIEVPV